MQKLTAQNGEGRCKSRPLYQIQPEVYDKVKWMATSERVNLLLLLLLFFILYVPTIRLSSFC